MVRIRWRDGVQRRASYGLIGKFNADGTSRRKWTKPNSPLLRRFFYLAQHRKMFEVVEDARRKGPPWKAGGPRSPRPPPLRRFPMHITSNAAQIAAAIRQFGRSLPQATRRGMDIWSRRTAAAVKAVAPSGRTRNLRRSILGRGIMIGRRPAAVLRVAARYSPFIEFGTKAHLVTPTRRKALRWIGKGKGKRGYVFASHAFIPKQQARPFFYTTIHKHLVSLAPEIARSAAMYLRR